MPEEIGTKANPWNLKTPPLTSDYQMYFDEKDGEPVIVCVVGSTTLLYARRAVEDLHRMLKAHGDWMDLAEVEHNPRNNRMRAL
ncbi:hypothetical protein BH11ARM2_BH11ARM2_36880 [soil metagenome]